MYLQTVNHKRVKRRRLRPLDSPIHSSYINSHITSSPSSLLSFHLPFYVFPSHPPPSSLSLSCFLASPSPSFLLRSAAEGASHVSSPLITIIDDGPDTVLRCSPALCCSATHTLSLPRGREMHYHLRGAAPARKKIRVITWRRDLQVRSVHYSLKL